MIRVTYEETRGVVIDKDFDADTVQVDRDVLTVWKKIGESNAGERVAYFNWNCVISVLKVEELNV